MIRKTIALGLIAGSLIFASLIVVGKNLPNSANTVNKEPVFLPKDGSLVESLPPETKTIGENTTQAVAKKVASELIKKDLKNLKDLKPEKLVDVLITKQIENFDLNAFNPEVDSAKLKIVKSSERKLVENYLKNFQAILNNNFSQLSIDFSQPSAEDLERLTKAYQKVIGEFYSLIVPENLASIHREEIRLLTVQKNIFENLSRYKDDPLKAVVSVRLLEETDKQFADLKKIINEKVF